MGPTSTSPTLHNSPANPALPLFRPSGYSANPATPATPAPATPAPPAPATPAPPAPATPAPPASATPASPAPAPLAPATPASATPAPAFPASKTFVKSKKRKKKNKAGYTAHTSCGRVGRGVNTRFNTFQLDLHDQRTDGR